jgi:hypothetical protein
VVCLRAWSYNTLLLDALAQPAPRSVRYTVSYLEVGSVLHDDCTLRSGCMITV